MVLLVNYIRQRRKDFLCKCKSEVNQLLEVGETPETHRYLNFFSYLLHEITLSQHLNYLTQALFYTNTIHSECKYRGTDCTR